MRMNSPFKRRSHESSRNCHPRLSREPDLTQPRRAGCRTDRAHVRADLLDHRHCLRSNSDNIGSFVIRRRHDLTVIPEPIQTTDASDRFAIRAVAIAIGLTVLLLFIMMISSFMTSRRIGHMNERTGSHH